MEEGGWRWRRRRRRWRWCCDPCSQGAFGEAVSMANPPWKRESIEEVRFGSKGGNGWEMRD